MNKMNNNDSYEGINDNTRKYDNSSLLLKSKISKEDKSI